MKKKMLFSATILLLSLAVATTALFAWFTSGKAYISNIEFETGRIEMTVELFSVGDFNRDGIPDHNALSENGLYLYDIVHPAEGTLAGIVVENALPGQIFSFRMVAKNLSPNPSSFALSMTAEPTPTGQRLNDCFSFSANVGNTEYKVPLAGGKVVVVDEPDGSSASRIPLIVIAGKSTLTFDFRLTFEHLEALQANPATASVFQGKTDLNEYLGLGFESCKFFFEFRQSENGAA